MSSRVEDAVPARRRQLREGRSSGVAWSCGIEGVAIAGASTAACTVADASLQKSWALVGVFGKASGAVVGAGSAKVSTKCGAAPVVRWHVGGSASAGR